MAIDVQDVGLVLLGTCGDEQVGDRDSVLSLLSELAMRGQRRLDRLRVHPQIAECVEALRNAGIVAGVASC